MNIESVIVLIFTILFSIAGIIMLRYEWIRLEKKENSEIAEDISFWKFPKWLWVYGAVMLMVQISFACLLPIIYIDNTACMFIKRLGLLVLIWQAAATDWKYQKIPNDIILVGVAFRVSMLIPEYIFEREQIVSTLISEGIALAGIVLLVLICLLLMKNSIGMGDLKLLMIMAVCQGFNGIMSSGFLSMLISFFAAIVLLLTKKKTRKDTLPFAPCILAGTLLSVFMTGV